MKQAIIFGISGLLIGVLFGFLIFSKSSHASVSEHSRMTMDHSSMIDNSMTMTEMVGMLYDKTGDAFDKAFILGMIGHHQGAIDMAKEAQKNAKHAEIKRLADDIITAQTSEIEMMKQWQKAWGY